jgi:hypothetical protein
MIYIKIKPDYSCQELPDRVALLLDNCALNPPIWERKPEKPGVVQMPYGYELIVPVKVAELLPGSWYFLRSYTSEELVPLHADKILFNDKTGAAVPNAALWSVTDVRVETDLCTDLLQEFLRQGWHILAVCPQPQRRPDYVLGKGPKLGAPELPRTKVDDDALPDNTKFAESIPF